MDGIVEWAGTVILTTPRLVLRTFRSDALPRYAALNADPEVARYLGGRSPARSRTRFAEWAQQTFEDEGLGLLAVERREDGAFLGMCGLHHQQSYADDVEVGWRLARQHWGGGRVFDHQRPMVRSRSERKDTVVPDATRRGGIRIQADRIRRRSVAASPSHE